MTKLSLYLFGPPRLELNPARAVIADIHKLDELLTATQNHTWPDLSEIGQRSKVSDLVPLTARLVVDLEKP